MTIAFPRQDILTSVGFADQRFQLLPRQEYSRQANGVTRGKDFGSAIWMADWTTSSLDFDRALAFEAKLNSLDGLIGTFYAHDLRRPFPQAHKDGVFADSGLLDAVGSNNKSLRLRALPAGFVLSEGDYLAFDYGVNRALHQVSESVTASGAGLTVMFEVRPHVRPGFVLSAPVTLKKPSARMALTEAFPPSALDGPTRATVSFQAAQILL